MNYAMRCERCPLLAFPSRPSTPSEMVLHLVGVGLGDEQDITLRGLNALKRCSKIYLEAYTSVLTVPKEQLEEAWGVAIEIADRQLCEEGCEEAILQRALTEEVALLVVGDPFGATTHTDLLHRAREMAVTTNVVHNASIMNAVGCWLGSGSGSGLGLGLWLGLGLGLGLLANLVRVVLGRARVLGPEPREARGALHEGDRQVRVRVASPNQLSRSTPSPSSDGRG